jgi:hypothetical protein
MNPYNCTQPGNLFTGYSSELEWVTDGFQNNKNFTVLGGHRSGKTSFLLQVRDHITRNGVTGRQAFARLIDLGGYTPSSPFEFFEIIYKQVVSGSEAEAWDKTPVTQPYQAFLERIRRAAPALEKKHGDKWLAVLLIDKLDLARSDEIFQNLRNLFQLDSLYYNFRLVGTGGSAMLALVKNGSPLFNILAPVCLRALSEPEADELLASGPPEWRALRGELFALSGRHPYILQGLLEKLWDAPGDLHGAARQFSYSLGLVFQHWKRVLGPEGCAVYRAIAGSDAGLTETQVRQRSKVNDVDETLRVLGFHGVIDQSDRPRVLGTLFRDWFQRNDDAPPQMAAKRFSVAFSFAGETRDRVAPIASLLAQRLTRDRVLYDKFYPAEFARPNLDLHLQRLYREDSDLIVVVICADYQGKPWTGLEWRAIRTVLNKGGGDSIMLLRKDRAELDGTDSTVDGFLELEDYSDDQAADLILERLKQR